MKEDSTGSLGWKIANDKRDRLIATYEAYRQSGDFAHLKALTEQINALIIGYRMIRLERYVKSAKTIEDFASVATEKIVRKLSEDFFSNGGHLFGYTINAAEHVVADYVEYLKKIRDEHGPLEVRIDEDDATKTIDNPEIDKNVRLYAEDTAAALRRAESRLGLTGKPREIFLLMQDKKFIGYTTRTEEPIMRPLTNADIGKEVGLKPKKVRKIRKQIEHDLQQRAEGRPKLTCPTPDRLSAAQLRRMRVISRRLKEQHIWEVYSQDAERKFVSNDECTIEEEWKNYLTDERKGRENQIPEAFRKPEPRHVVEMAASEAYKHQAHGWQVMIGERASTQYPSLEKYITTLINKHVFKTYMRLGGEVKAA